MECDLQGVTGVQRVRTLRIERGLLSDDVEVLAECNLGVHVGETTGECPHGVATQGQGLLIRRIDGS